MKATVNRTHFVNEGKVQTSKINIDARIALGIVSQYKVLILANVAILLSSAAFEGVGVGMLVPILQSIEGKAGGGIFVEWATYLFNSFGVNYNAINLIIFFGVLILFRFFLLIVSQRLSRVLSSSITRDLRKDCLDNLMQVSMTHFYKNKIGDIVATLFNSTQNSGGFTEYFMLMLKGTIFCCVYITVAMLLSVELTLFILVAVLLTYVFVWPRFKKSEQYGQIEKRLMDEIISGVQDRLGGIRVIKSFNKEKAFYSEFSQQVDNYQKNDVRIMDNKLIAFAFFEPFIFFLLIVGILFAYTSLLLPLESMIVSLFVFTLIIPQFKLVNSNILQIKQLLPHFRKVEDLMSREGKVYLKNGARNLISINKSTEVKNLFFRYLDNGPNVINDFSVAIPTNSTLALVGPSGGGKSTFADLLLRNLDPDGGSIEVDGTNLKEFKIKDWKKLTSIVDQDPYLFQGTIMDNIKFFSEETDDEVVFESSKIANAHAFILNLDQGYQTEVGFRGMTLSGGQRQRVALARAIVRKPSLLILDEATSSLDSESENAIRNSLDKLKGQLTLVIIAHRLSTIKTADLILFVANGQIIERGTHQELISNNAEYNKFLKMQFNDEV